MAERANPARTPSTWSETGAVEMAAQVDDWIAIEKNGTVRVNSGKVELGTGVRTALAQIAAEELEVPIDRIVLEMGNTGVTPDEGYTAGSKTIQFGGFAIRMAAAEARKALLELAAERFGVGVERLSARDGKVSVGGDPARSARYEELTGGRPFGRKISGSAPLKARSEYHLVGEAVPRVELPGKFFGVGSYVHDIRLPGMLHARVVRPPSPGAALLSLGGDGRESGSALLGGRARLISKGGFVAVLAEREEDAIEAAKAVTIEWRERRELPAQAELHEYILEQPAAVQEVVNEGDLATRMQAAASRIEATYYQPFQAHASIGPSCAVAEMTEDTMTVYASTQGVYPLRGALADLLGMPEEKVHVVHREGAGCYGHNGADDAAADAAILARETGRPVRVQWSREDEFLWEPYGPAMVMRLRGGIDGQGRVVAWEDDVWSPSHTTRARSGIDLIAAQLIAGTMPPAKKLYIGGNRNAPVDYEFPSRKVTMHWLERLPLRTSSFRSLGAFANTFANESFIDELAAAASADPVEFRLRHLSDPRAREVVEGAARAANWGDPLPEGEGRGVAFARYENEEAYVATVAQIAVDPESGRIHVKRITVAHDCGLIINPDGLENQIEGNVIQSMSRALLEQVRWEGGRVASVDWMSYPILKFSEVPEVQIVLINRPEERSVGAGEPATITTAPAIANALFAAVGVRLRSVPFGRQAAAAGSS